MVITTGESLHLIFLVLRYICERAGKRDGDFLLNLKVEVISGNCLQKRNDVKLRVILLLIFVVEDFCAIRRGLVSNRPKSLHKTNRQILYFSHWTRTMSIKAILLKAFVKVDFPFRTLI